MTKDEALKMAIEALKDACGLTPRDAHFCKAINACKEALKPHPDCDEACMFQCQMEKKHNQWQGLTDDEISKIWWADHYDYLEYAKLIEQALKEKNYGS